MRWWGEGRAGTGFGDADEVREDTGLGLALWERRWGARGAGLGSRDAIVELS